MNHKNFNETINAQIERCKSVLLNKAAEYAADDDRLHNFNVAAALEGVSIRQALYGMMAKHVISIADMCMSDKVYGKSMWDEKITDNINYLLLLSAVISKEEQP